ncbi:ATP-NAD kinase [Thermogymnomonas acidicola]|uniref:ATP-NAD kinase n=1 Tax=Thermogymnomonas acidicola TaxID=399579 RepID=A0AA37F9J6_9ARCH|nr:ATP-NAD kinase family protein [Thermogymnomonas acidicola]GGM73918.1 ATP-NAD kinase [Thermogymnomonas acidicola]
MRVGFLVNPVAGSGLYRSLRGSDTMREQVGNYAHTRALTFLRSLRSRPHLLTCSGPMGEQEIVECGLSDYEVIHSPGSPTSARDTEEFCRKALEEDADIIVFVGGDGTARDVTGVVDRNIPVLGVPAGMKMYSGVFASSPEAAAAVLDSFGSSSQISLEEADVVDADEISMSRGSLRLVNYGKALVPGSGGVVACPKFDMGSPDSSDIVEYIIDNMRDGVAYVVGTGRTCKSLVRALGEETNEFGVDIVLGGRVVVRDATEERIFNEVSRRESVAILSPIGGQGFILGRGNRQISRRVMEKVTWPNVLVISTLQKLLSTPQLRIDSEYAGLPGFNGFTKVLYGYGLFRMLRVTEI